MLHLCVDGWRLYHIWSSLLDQTKPKAGKKDIAEAKRLYIEHRKTCKECTRWTE